MSIQAIEKAAKRLSRLLKTTERVDYDLDAYAAEAAELIDSIPSTKQFAGKLTVTVNYNRNVSLIMFMLCSGRLESAARNAKGGRSCTEIISKTAEELSQSA